MESNNQIDSKDGQTAPGDLPRSEGRRKLIRGALAGAPILLALKSTPVLACNCKQPSGFSTSGNLSRNAGATCSQPANGPNFWAYRVYKSNGIWYFSGTGIQTGTQFKAIFGGTDSQTLLNILKTSPSSFASLAISAYLDIKSSAYVTGVSTNDIVKMWQGTYAPPPVGSPRWSRLECENYLRYTMGLS